MDYTPEMQRELAWLALGKPAIQRLAKEIVWAGFTFKHALLATSGNLFPVGRR